MYGSQTPIDIHCAKLVDWLVQRRHCKRDWGEKLAVIRRKIRSALKDMPENDDIKSLLVGSKLDYFKSKRIVELLKETEADSKNIFGYYSSQRMKDWQDIVYSYERDCIFLAEIATDLIRESNYEVPGIRKVIGRLHREKEDAERERANQMRKAQQFQSEYSKLAASFGIKGDNIEQELIEHSKSLTVVMEDLVKSSRELKSSMQYYHDYAALTSKQQVNEFLPMLAYVIANGNTTVYHWKHNVAPEAIQRSEKSCCSNSNSNPSDIELVDDEIDFGEDLPSSESSSGFVHVDKSENAHSEADGAFVQLDTNMAKASEANDKIARGDDALLVLEFRKTRNQFINNLYELNGFFEQLRANATSTTGTNETMFAADGIGGLRKLDISDIEQELLKIQSMFETINLERNKISFQLNDSSSFVENIKEKFANKMKQASDCKIKAEQISEQIKEVDLQIGDAEAQLKKSLISARDLRDRVEFSLKELYSGRPINIMGCVN